MAPALTARRSLALLALVAATAGPGPALGARLLREVGDAGE